MAAAPSNSFFVRQPMEAGEGIGAERLLQRAADETVSGGPAGEQARQRLDAEFGADFDRLLGWQTSCCADGDITDACLAGEGQGSAEQGFQVSAVAFLKSETGRFLHLVRAGPRWRRHQERAGWAASAGQRGDVGWGLQLQHLLGKVEPGAPAVGVDFAVCGHWGPRRKVGG
jgi:hypothetical protein